jgi:hypothetical protein
MEGGVMPALTEQLEPTAKLRIVKVLDEYVLQQWWSNAVNVRMGPTQMIRGEWRDVEVVDDHTD